MKLFLVDDQAVIVCSGCAGDLVHIRPGLPHVSSDGPSELHGGSGGHLYDCGGLSERS